MQVEKRQQLLVTGATGYIGSRLVPRLLEAGYRVRVLVRDQSRLAGRPWRGQVEIIEGDVADPATLGQAMQAIDVAYYLIHSMSDSGSFAARDQQLAQAFSAAAAESGVQRLIYLGGLGEPGSDLSAHLRSRQETGDSLRQGGVPVTEFRAAVIVGSGSLSFEMIRNLTERLPAMICPRWVYTRTQPIGIRDVLAYLVGALEQPASSGHVIEIGGADIVTYGMMMTQYAEVRGLKRWLIPVPVLTPRLSSYWVHWMTPVSASIARPLIEGLKNEVIVRQPLARQLFPDIEPADYKTSVERALVVLDAGKIESTWADAVASSNGDAPPVTLQMQEGMILETRILRSQAHPQQLYRSFISLGGERGWLYSNWLWKLRGGIDRLLGGVGLRRGRREAHDLRIGDAVDFWRVEQLEDGQRLLMRAEMKVPGKAWLEYLVFACEEGDAELQQRAYFAPKGLSGILYWYALYPLHALIFSGLARRIVADAESATLP